MNQLEDTYGCPIDWEDIFSRIGDESIISEFADSFLKNGQTLMLSVKSAVQSHSIDQIELYAHALKGSASNIGAIPLAKAAWQLEKAGSEKQIDDADELLTAIEQAYEALTALLEKRDWMDRAKRAVQVKA
jgi:HPt (histidine-containing phosphotransfer) domain-containing protein